ncbi:class I adenylate-forming enzyme family protein [Trujillonella humicola]|uniref:class I adenylate-forming enzyme family protein n=1 Tax=Trujillonella humicola TaxID=3383699 RepID=UPI0039057631
MTSTTETAVAVGDWPWLLQAPTFPALVRARAGATPDALFLVDEADRQVTCAQFAERVDRVAAALHAEGIGPGSRVAWQLPTRISTVLVMAALRRLSAVQAPVIPLYREREVTVALRTTDAEYFLVPGSWRGLDYAEMAAGIAADGGPAPRVLVIGDEAPERDDTAGLPPEPADPDEVAWIYFTSGSTGAPKGARHTDAGLLATGSGFAGNGRLGADGREMGAMGFPVAHVGGIEYLISALTGGYGLLLLEAFVPDQAVALMARYGVTTTGGAPPFYSALIALARAADADRPLLPALRVLKGGGAPCPPDLYRQVREVLGVQLAHDYGMTEVPMVAVADPRDDDEVLARTDGRVLPFNRVRVVDADGGAVPSGESGEVQVSGIAVCRGYTDPAETARAFTDDGFFRTGDLGRLLPTGHIEIVGRLKDLIIRKGENIAPQEIEELLAQHPAVAEVAVLGLPDPDRGERVCAVVVVAPGQPEPTLATLTDWLRGRGLMPQKLPEQLELVDVLPRTGLAKIAKNELRSRLAAGT